MIKSSKKTKARRKERRLKTSEVRKLVFERDGNRCLKCGTTENLQLSHIYPKGKYRKMEHDPLNLKILCYFHHLHWWHKHPLEAGEWIRSVLPKERIDYLKELSLR